ALLDLAIVQHLYSAHPEAGPQWLTEHKMAMVSNKFLAVLCVTLGLHKHLQSTSPSLLNQITTFSEEVEERQKAAKGIDWWTSVKTPPPKALSDVVESTIGAMFVDSEFDFSTTVKF